MRRALAVMHSLKPAGQQTDGRELNAPSLEAPRSALEENAIKPRPMGALDTVSSK
jgi:hypothetical protein